MLNPKVLQVSAVAVITVYLFVSQAEPQTGDLMRRPGWSVASRLPTYSYILNTR